MFDLFFGVAVITAMIRMATPIILVSLGGLFGHKAKVLNIGLESFILIASFFAMWGSYLFENPVMGLIFAITAGAVSSLIFALFVIYFKSNPVIVGISLNLASWGITTLLLDLIFHVRGVFIHQRIKSFKPIHIPLIKDIPIIGRILSGYNILVYLAFLLVIVAYIVMYKTSFGLRLRGVGIKSLAAQTVGINVNKYKLIAILLGGIMAGFSGGYLVLGGSSMFTESMSAGRGFLALAAIMVGDGHPIKVFLACMVFGYTSALSVTLQGLGIPSQIVLALPYVFTVIVLLITAIFSKRKRLNIV